MPGSAVERDVGWCVPPTVAVGDGNTRAVSAATSCRSVGFGAVLDRRARPLGGAPGLGSGGGERAGGDRTGLGQRLGPVRDGRVADVMAVGDVRGRSAGC